MTTQHLVLQQGNVGFWEGRAARLKLNRGDGRARPGLGDSGFSLLNTGSLTEAAAGMRCP